MNDKSLLRETDRIADKESGPSEMFNTQDNVSLLLKYLLGLGASGYTKFIWYQLLVKHFMIIYNIGKMAIFGYFWVPTSPF